MDVLGKNYTQSISILKEINSQYSNIWRDEPNSFGLLNRIILYYINNKFLILFWETIKLI